MNRQVYELLFMVVDSLNSVEYNKNIYIFQGDVMSQRKGNTDLPVLETVASYLRSICAIMLMGNLIVTVSSYYFKENVRYLLDASC